MKSKYFLDPFLNILPTIDVHGETADTVRLVIKEFIRDNQIMGKYKLAVIHGRGGGILKNSIHEYLKKNKHVETFYIYSGNSGITIIELKKI